MVIDIYNSHKSFDTEFEFYCFKNCYRQLLEHYGVKNAVYYIDCTIDWLFQTDDKNKFGYTFSTGEVYSSFLPPFSEKVRMCDCQSMSIDEIWSINKQKIAEGIPVVSATDVFFLDYTPYFNKKHSFHSIILCGFSEDGRQWNIVDWYAPWFYKGVISTDNLAQARGSQNPADGILSGTPINYMWTEVENTGWNAENQELIFTTIDLALDRFYGTHNKEETSFKGADALSALLPLIEKGEAMEESTRGEFLEDLHAKLYFTPTRKNLFKYYIQSVYNDYGYVKLEPVLKALTGTISNWKKLLSMIVKCNMTNAKADYIKIIEYFKELLLKEKHFYYTLYEAGRSIKTN